MAQPLRTPFPRPMSIAARQDQPEHLDRLAACSHRYRIAARWRAARMTGTLLLAAAVPVLAYARPSWADQLAAAAALWLVIGRTALSWLERSSYLKAAAMQEHYDCKLFHLPWNETLAGPEPSAVDIAADAAKYTNRTRLLKWYDINLYGLAWPVDVLFCQLQSSSWSRRDHNAYAAALVTAATLWTASILAYGYLADLSLADFLVRLFLPSAPALLDAVELATSHQNHARERRKVEDVATSAWRAHKDGAPITTDTVRRVQDAIYQLRRDQPRVPNIVYQLRRSSSTQATVAAAAAIRNQ